MPDRPGDGRARDDDAQHVRDPAARAGHLVYRVRGYSFSLPTGAQAMSWSVRRRSSRAGRCSRSSATARSTRRRRHDDAQLGLRRAFARRSLLVPGQLPDHLCEQRCAPTRSGRRPRELRLTARDLATGAALFVQTCPGSRFIVAVRLGPRGSRRQQATRRAGSAQCAALRSPSPAGAGVRCTLTVRSNGIRHAAVLLMLQHRNVTYTLTYAGTSSPTRSTDAARFAAAARTLRFTS